MNFLENIHKLWETFQEKLVILLLIIIAFLGPIHGLLITIGLALCIDTFTGVIKAKKLKEKITSHKLFQAVTKTLIYQFSIILMFLIEKYMLNGLIQSFVDVELFATKILAIAFVYVEFKSILENLKLITGVDYIEKIKSVINYVKSAKKNLNETEKKDDNKQILND